MVTSILEEIIRIRYVFRIVTVRKLLRRIYRLFDVILASSIFTSFLICVLLRRLLGKVEMKKSQKKILSLAKDGINIILDCNNKDHFDLEFARPCADKTYVLYVGNEKPMCARVGRKVMGINIKVPLQGIKHYMPYTIRSLEQVYGFLVTLKFIKETSPKVLEVMFPSKLAFRALLLKFLLPIKMVAQVRGNLDLIYYFNPFPTFWPFKMIQPLLELFQVMWDKMISMLFYRSCDLVIGYNINNTLSAISNGAHPAKTKTSRIKIELTMLEVKIRERSEIQEIPNSGKIISLWSRLSPEKLVLECIQAFEKLLLLSDEDLNFLIIGDGPEKNRINAYLETSIYKDRIHLLGKRDRNFIAEVARYSAMALVPYGGSSLVEAVLLGKPIVAFDIEWHNELIRDGDTGYLADFPDIQHLSEKMLEVISNISEAEKRALSAKKLAKAMFNPEIIEAKETRYFESLLKA